METMQAEAIIKKPKSKEEAKEAKKDWKKKCGTMRTLDSDGIKLLTQLKERANKKAFGRKVRDAEILTVALGLVTAEHLKELQEKSYREKDRIALAHEEYQKANGKLSLEQFIIKLLKGEVRPT
jgi:hypothetical protein